MSCCRFNPIVDHTGGTVSNPIVIDEEDDDDEEEMEASIREEPTASPVPSYSLASSRTPHIVNPSHSSTVHQRSSHDQPHSRDLRRSVVVKRRFSSTTEGGVETSHECCTPLDTTATTITTISADNRHLHTTTTSTTPPLPVPVITEYAPSLPYLSAPLLQPYLAQQSIQTVIASSDNPLAGGDHINVDDVQQLPSINCEFSLCCCCCTCCCCCLLSQTERVSVGGLEMLCRGLALSSSLPLPSPSSLLPCYHLMPHAPLPNPLPFPS